MSTSNEKNSHNLKVKKRNLEKWLNSIGWGLFLILLGCIWLVPDEMVPEGTFNWFGRNIYWT